MKQCSTYAFFDFRELERSLVYTRHDYIQFHQEGYAKSIALFPRTKRRHRQRQCPLRPIGAGDDSPGELRTVAGE